jgi:hypothetical protein
MLAAWLFFFVNYSIAVYSVRWRYGVRHFFYFYYTGVLTVGFGLMYVLLDVHV